MRVCAPASALSLWHFNLYLMRMVRYGVMLLFYFVKKTIIHLEAKRANTNHHHHRCRTPSTMQMWPSSSVSSSLFFCYFFLTQRKHFTNEVKIETEILGTFDSFFGCLCLLVSIECDSSVFYRVSEVWRYTAHLLPEMKKDNEITHFFPLQIHLNWRMGCA